MKKFLMLICAVLLIIIGIGSWYIFKQFKAVKPPAAKPLLVYTFTNLKKTSFPATQISLGPITGETADSFSQIFYFSVPKTPGSKILLKASGLMNIPKKAGGYPVIVMFRGFVPDNIYKPGMETQPSAAVFVSKGFITLAPDFLGYGESASPSADPFENRFQTYVTALTLLSSSGVAVGDATGPRA